MNINSEKWLHGGQKSLDVETSRNPEMEAKWRKLPSNTSVLEGLRYVAGGGGEGWEIQGLGLGKPVEARPQGRGSGEAELLLRLY